MHSGWGVESASYMIPENLNYLALVSIKDILFQPVESDDAKFMIIAMNCDLSQINSTIG
jgi:hypothetical protein